MSDSFLRDAFGHHVWATLRVLDACLELDPDQLDTTVPGTYGSILDTARHLVGSDAGYLWVTSGGRFAQIEESGLSLAELRSEMEGHGDAWSSVLGAELDMDAMVVRHRDDGSTSSAPMSMRLAQVLHHGTDHRSQICTALTTLGVEPPEIDVWDYADHEGRLSRTPPTS